jgi:hypothetical protein
MITREIRMENYTFFCPNPDCPNHEIEENDNSWYMKKGSHHTKAFGKVQRYICRLCNRGFSDQTFSLNYYLKIKTDFREMFKQFNSSNSDCFTARHFDMSFDSLQIRRNRLARNALFFQSRIMENVNISESLCADGLETYTCSKYYPVNINILMGRESGFLYYFTESHQRRKGRMTEYQKQKTISEYADKSFSGSSLTVQFKKVIDFIHANINMVQVFLYTDEHKTYENLIDSYNHRSTSVIPENKTDNEYSVNSWKQAGRLRAMR